ncbi:thiopurine S-methyltransferase isoform X2 [Rhipicephalus sanguineus]|uniref:thiopurine S-methyltransferase isoform X2 n=1 Tax=Rhipicephalus sanguineus TaxID=34632 RepID=UPI001895D089|nr:thiopurine S-methyltransferase isoform X2 [Rhipicephalus sanguineus]
MECATPQEPKEYWSHVWKQERPLWQQEGVTKLLSDNKEAIFAGKTGARVFIPLCGKAHELKWFYDLGHSVIGVEFVEECVRSYFTESGLEMEEATCPIIKRKILRTPDHRLQVFICNIFEYKRYAAVIKDLLAPDFSYGMWTVVYDARTVPLQLAPRSAGEAALREHFGDVAPRIALVDCYVQEKACFVKGEGPFTFCLWHMTPSRSGDLAAMRS